MKKTTNNKQTTNKTNGKKQTSKKTTSNKQISSNQPKTKKSKYIVLAVFLGLFALAYFAGVIYFETHFQLNTRINHQNFSGKTIEDVNRFLSETVNQYVLTIIDYDNSEHLISGSEIGLEFFDNGQTKELLHSQNSFLWPISFFTMTETEAVINVVYDQSALNTLIFELGALNREQIPPTNPTLEFENTEFMIRPETPGNQINVVGLQTSIINAIKSLSSVVHIVEEDLFVKPTYTTESEKVIAALDQLNHHVSASITYEMYEPVVVDAPLIASWLSYNENYDVHLDENAISAWMDEFATDKTTVGTTRYLTTPRGREVSVSGGNYGWRVDRETELEALISYIRGGETISKEPAFSQRAASFGANDWGNTFLQVDMIEQVLWFIRDGEVVFESPVVTGLANTSRATPPGVFSIIEMQQNRVLRGPRNAETGDLEWESPVSYWMRITWSGIGFHDATWQSSFGGDRFRTHGSRGCINMPLDKARELYSLVQMGTPVVLFN